MAETLRVNDQYIIQTPDVVIYGNLTVAGETTTISTVNSTIKDAIITLNQGQSGTGITNVVSGIAVDRGGGESPSVVYNENEAAWQIRIGESLTRLQAALPVEPSDVVTKQFLQSSAGVAGANTQIQFNSSNVFGASANLTFDGTTLKAFDIGIAAGAISTSTTNGNIQISANGTGTIVAKSAVRLDNLGSNPAAIANSSTIYSKTPGNAGSGVYYTHSNSTDELVSRSKAILFGLIF